MRACLCLIAIAACSSAPPPRHDVVVPPPVDDTAVRIRVALAEAQRADGLAELATLARSDDPAARPLALRGLGRIGGADARAILLGALASPHETDVIAAAHALGIAAMLDEPAPDPAIDAALGKLLAARSDAVVRAAIDAIGRASAAAMQERLVEAARERQVAAEVALALGRHGRRKLALGEPARGLLAELARSPDRDTRYAATWALSREHAPAGASEALVANAADRDPEIAATAIGGLARRKPASPLATPPSTDWRVAVELVRHRTREGATTDEVAQATAAVTAAIAQAEPTLAHVAIEGLRGLARHPGPPTPAPVATGISHGWIDCLAQARALRLPSTTSFAPLERCGLPDHLRLPLLAGLVEAKAGTLAARRAALRTLLSHADARVKAAGLGALVALWPDGDANDRRAAVASVVSALGSTSVLLAGAAVETAEPLYAAMAGSQDDAHREALDHAIVARAAAEQDIELAASLYGLIGKRALVAGLAACRRGALGPPASAKAAGLCLEKLGEPAPPSAAKLALPPADIDVRRVIGKRWRWKLETTRGRIDIELLPDRAPWAVAAIVRLTEKRYYDGLELHRVVPNFVVQGGDPTESGWGGPGFALPSEPSTDAGFVEGGVGIADAGRDSGGSQWFIMHGRAPHLDGRYTWFGRVIAGQAHANALQIGDEVVKATVEPLQ